MKKKILVLLFLLLSFGLFAQKREFRGSWVSSISNLDWPSSRSLTVAQQKAELINILDELKALNMNAVLLQVRPEGDALYNSSIEPWSYWLTGTQGTAPSPLYDPLEFAIEEAHARGIELHAWLNPFRAEANIGSYTLHSSHVVNTHPEWILTFNSIDLKLIDPGKALARAYVQSVVMDIVNNYDVDGIVFDDYFYPYPNSSVSFSGITNEDAATFSSESRGFTNLADWRRDNVNLFVANVNTAIKASKPYVKFGISPFGIWKNNTPSGIIGMDAYSEIYCDATAWLQAGTIDYLSPQLYWEFGGSQDYGTLLPWWGTQLSGKHLYSSLALYQSSSWAANEITNQIDLNRSNSNCDGTIYFRHSYFGSDPHGIKSTLQTSYYQNSAIAPEMNWLGGSAPNEPTNVLIAEGNSENTISWTNSLSSNLKFNVIYRSTTSPIDVTNESNIIGIVNSTESSYSDNSISNSTQYYYVISTSNKYDLESDKSIEVQTSPSSSNLVIDDFETNEGHFFWKPTDSGSTTGVSTSSSADRSTAESKNGTASEKIVLLDDSGSSDDWYVRLVSGGGAPANNTSITGNEVGYWIKTSSASNSSQVGLWIDDSDGYEKSILVDVINDGIWHLYRWDLDDNAQWTTGSGNGEITSTSVTIDAIIFSAPNASPDWTVYLDDVYSEEVTPTPVELEKFDVNLVYNGIMLNWTTATEVNNYGFEVEASRDLPVQWEVIGFVDGHGNSNSTKNYSFFYTESFVGKVSFRLKQIDTDGSFEYSDFVTVKANGLAKTELFQNHPNPFNPSTQINFSLSEMSNVKITVFNMLGQEVTELVNTEMASGAHSVKFDGSNLTSGFYIYRLETPNYSKTMKMLLVK